jgi:hypothetical protein
MTETGKLSFVHANVGGATGARTGAPKTAADAFNLWLNAKLVSLYGPALRGPMPDDLIGLIEGHRGKRDD